MLRKFDPVRVIEGFKPLVHFLSASRENEAAAKMLSKRRQLSPVVANVN